MAKKPNTIFQKAYDAIDGWELDENAKKNLAKLEKEVIKMLKEVGGSSLSEVMNILVDMLRSLKKRLF